MTEQQNDAADKVCLIGQTVYQNLFPPGEDPIGASHPDQGRAHAGHRLCSRPRGRPASGRTRTMW